MADSTVSTTFVCIYRTAGRVLQELCMYSTAGTALQ